MNKVKLLALLVGGLVIVNLGLLAFLLWGRPQPPELLPGGGADGPRQLIIQRLQLDASQQVAYDSLITLHRTAVTTLEREIRDDKNKLYRSLAQDTTGKEALIQELGQLQLQMEQVHYAHFYAIRTLCHPDQLPAFDRLTNDLARYFAPGRQKRP